MRDGKSVRADEAFSASTSQDLTRMLSALDVKTNKVDRHFLLMAIVAETYKHRSDPGMAQTCARVAEMHIAEFPQIAGPLKKDMDGILPRVSTFQHYATLLAEQSKFDRAIEICEIAIRFELHDGTKSGFEGRINRIKKQQKKSSR
ncbi:MAG: hypothetical protein ABGZ35_18840 [Planctomycetaceae bacterium]